MYGLQGLRGARIGLLFSAFAFLCLAAGLLVWALPTRTLPGSTESVSAIPAIYATCGTNEECIKTGIAGIANSDPAGSVDAVLALFDSPSTAPRPGCHWAMHLLGQTLKSRTRSGESIGLDGRWHLCGYAVLHGAFEDIPLNGDASAVGKTAFGICLSGVIEKSMEGQCFHAIGHTVGMNLAPTASEPHLVRAETACAWGAWDFRDKVSAGMALKACVSGAHMRYRDTVLKPSGARVVSEGRPQGEVLPQCEVSMFAYACITLYMEDAFAARSYAAAGDLLEWCNRKSPDAVEVCGFFYGLAARWLPNDGVRAALAFCVGNPELTSGTHRSCLRGLLESGGDGPTGGFKRTEHCAVAESLGWSCAESESFVPTYPEVSPPPGIAA